MIELDSVDKSFGTVQAVRNFSLKIEKGLAVCLFGPSGSGKTTVLRLIAGLERPDRGRIKLNDRLVSGEGVLVPAGERKVGMVFQDLALWPHMKVHQHLDYVLRGLLPPRERKRKTEHLLELFRMAHRRDAYPGSLSGGEAQRLALARAVAPDPLILLLDEPFSHVDQDLKKKFLDLLAQLKSEKHMTMIIVSHEESYFMGFFDYSYPILSASGICCEK